MWHTESRRPAQVHLAGACQGLPPAAETDAALLQACA